MSLAVNSSLPTTTLWMECLDLVTALDSNKESTVRILDIRREDKSVQSRQQRRNRKFVRSSSNKPEGTASQMQHRLERDERPDETNLQLQVLPAATPFS